MGYDEDGYYTGDPPPGYGPTGLEQCDIKCRLCQNWLPVHIIVGTHVCPGGIDYVTNFLEKNGAVFICNNCYEEMRLERGRLDKVDLK